MIPPCIEKMLSQLYFSVSPASEAVRIYGIMVVEKAWSNNYVGTESDHYIPTILTQKVKKWYKILQQILFKKLIWFHILKF